MSRLSLSIVALCLWSLGCDGSGSGPLGVPTPTSLMTHFAGTWAPDLERTLAVREEAGGTEAESRQIREFLAKNPALSLHPALTFTGNIAVGDEQPTSE